MSAFAVATAGGNGAGCAGCVCAKHEGGREKKSGEKNEPQEGAAKARLKREGRDHEGSVRVAPKKTTGAVGLGDSGQRF